MSLSKKLYKKILPELAIDFIRITARSLLGRETVRSSLRAAARHLFTGSHEVPFQTVATAERYADQIMEALNQPGAPLNCIGIDGPPGSGKSTLGRALAERSGLKWQTLFWQELKAPYPFKDGVIYENIRLIRTQDMDHFDAVIYIDCPPEEAQNRVITRDRNGALADVVDFSRLKKIGDTAFEMLGGEEVALGDGAIRIKQRPEGGYGDLERLKARLKAAAVSGVDVDALSKEELLFVACYGVPKSGVLPYFNSRAFDSDILTGMYGALHKSITKRLLR